jgi:hypothetical protein
MWNLWWTKWHWSRFPPNTSVSPTNYHSTNCSVLIYHPGLIQRPLGGRCTKWTQSHPHLRSNKLIHPSVRLSVCPSVHPSIYPSIYLFANYMDAIIRCRSHRTIVGKVHDGETLLSDQILRLPCVPSLCLSDAVRNARRFVIVVFVLNCN